MKDCEVLVASTLVVTKEDHVPVRHMNLSSEALTLRRGTDAAVLEPVESVALLERPNAVSSDSTVCGEFSMTQTFDGAV